MKEEMDCQVGTNGHKTQNGTSTDYMYMKVIFYLESELAAVLHIFFLNQFYIYKKFYKLGKAAVKLY